MSRKRSRGNSSVRDDHCVTERKEKKAKIEENISQHVSDNDLNAEGLLPNHEQRIRNASTVVLID